MYKRKSEVKCCSVHIHFSNTDLADCAICLSYAYAHDFAAVLVVGCILAKRACYAIFSEGDISLNVLHCK